MTGVNWSQLWDAPEGVVRVGPLPLLPLPVLLLGRMLVLRAAA
jgi:hypothetical protein